MDERMMEPRRRMDAVKRCAAQVERAAGEIARAAQQGRVPESGLMDELRRESAELQRLRGELNALLEQLCADWSDAAELSIEQLEERVGEWEVRVRMGEGIAARIADAAERLDGLRAPGCGAPPARELARQAAEALGECDLNALDALQERAAPYLDLCALLSGDVGAARRDGELLGRLERWYPQVAWYVRARMRLEQGMTRFEDISDSAVDGLKKSQPKPGAPFRRSGRSRADAAKSAPPEAPKPPAPPEPDRPARPARAAAPGPQELLESPELGKPPKPARAAAPGPQELPEPPELGKPPKPARAAASEPPEPSKPSGQAEPGRPARPSKPPARAAVPEPSGQVVAPGSPAAPGPSEPASGREPSDKDDLALALEQLAEEERRNPHRARKPREELAPVDMVDRPIAYMVVDMNLHALSMDERPTERLRKLAADYPEVRALQALAQAEADGEWDERAPDLIALARRQARALDEIREDMDAYLGCAMLLSPKYVETERAFAGLMAPGEGEIAQAMEAVAERRRAQYDRVEELCARLMVARLPNGVRLSYLGGLAPELNAKQLVELLRVLMPGLMVLGRWRALMAGEVTRRMGQLPKPKPDEPMLLCEGFEGPGLWRRASWSLREDYEDEPLMLSVSRPRKLPKRLRAAKVQPGLLPCPRRLGGR